MKQWALGSMNVKDKMRDVHVMKEKWGDEKNGGTRKKVRI